MGAGGIAGLKPVIAVHGEGRRPFLGKGRSLTPVRGGVEIESQLFSLQLVAEINREHEQSLAVLGREVQNLAGIQNVPLVCQGCNFPICSAHNMIPYLSCYILFPEPHSQKVWYKCRFRT